MTCFGHVLDMCGTCFGACLGHVWDMFWTCVGYFLDIFWTCFGHVLDMIGSEDVIVSYNICWHVFLKMIISYLVAKSQFWKKIDCFGRNNYLFFLFGGQFTNQWSRLMTQSVHQVIQSGSAAAADGRSLEGALVAL